MSWLSDLLQRLKGGSQPLSFPDLPLQSATITPKANSMTIDEFRRAAGISDDLAARWLPHIEEAMRNFKIDTPLQMAHFIAQVGHESGGFTKVIESLNYSVSGLRATFPTRISVAQANMYGRTDSQPANQQAIGDLAYGGRLGNRLNTHDGYNFRGRGLIQITGRTNYKACGEGIGVDLENQPALLAEDKYAALSAAWYWDWRNINSAAESDDVTRVTRLINGGTVGLDDRKARLDKAKAVLCV